MLRMYSFIWLLVVCPHIVWEVWFLQNCWTWSVTLVFANIWLEKENSPNSTPCMLVCDWASQNTLLRSILLCYLCINQNPTRQYEISFGLTLGMDDFVLKKWIKTSREEQMGIQCRWSKRTNIKHTHTNPGCDLVFSLAEMILKNDLSLFFQLSLRLLSNESH